MERWAVAAAGLGLRGPAAAALAIGLGALGLVACGTPTPSADAPPPAPTASAVAEAASAPPVAPAEPPPTASAQAAAPSATASASAAPEPPAPIVRDNKVKPKSDGEELQERAKKLLESIAKDDPAVGQSFWFPKEPFIPLKAIKDPGGYWEQLNRAYAKDIHKLHASRSSWQGATFDRFEIGSAPKWVKPNEEANAIGYYRSFRGKLHYSIGSEKSSIEVHTVITWQGLWYVTHLSKFKK